MNAITQHHRLRLIPVLLLCLSLASCSADYYRRDADRQVAKLLRDRKEKTLGYDPSTPIQSRPAPEPTKNDYAKIPATPWAPQVPPPIEISQFHPTTQRLGPEMLFPAGTEGPQFDRADAELRRESHERLRLGPPAAGPAAVVQLDLIGAIQYAVQHSRNFETQLEDLYLSALGVTLERHLFEPRPFVTQSLIYDGGQADVNYRSALTATTTAGVKQQLPYGGEVTAKALVSFVNALNSNTASGESADIALTASIPLLRGAGMVNLEPLIQSERELVYQTRRFEDFRRQFVVNVATQYFALLTRQQNIANRRYKVISSSELTERTRELYAAGRISFLEVQRSLQQALSDDNSLVIAQQSYENALDNFKILLGMPVTQNLDIVGVDLDVNAPELASSDMEQLLRLALKYRLDLQTARDQISDAQRKVAVAKNGLLPDLDFVADTTVGNQHLDPASNLDSRTLQYSAGVNLDLPIDRVAERNVYRRALIQFERSQRNFSEVRDGIVADVRQSVRGIQSAQTTLEIQQRAIELARRRVEYSNELLIQGKVSARDVVESQNSLLTAQDTYNAAKADLQTTILQFLRDTGTLRVDPAAGTLGHALDLRMHPRQREEPELIGSDSVSTSGSTSGLSGDKPM